MLILSVAGACGLVLSGCQQAIPDPAAASPAQPVGERLIIGALSCNIPDFPMPVGATRTFSVPYTAGCDYEWFVSPGLGGNLFTQFTATDGLAGGAGAGLPVDSLDVRPDRVD
jgi:hypothetical protein